MPHFNENLMFIIVSLYIYFIINILIYTHSDIYRIYEITNKDYYSMTQIKFILLFISRTRRRE
jgi:hypothetical protein